MIAFSGIGAGGPASVRAGNDIGELRRGLAETKDPTRS